MKELFSLVCSMSVHKCANSDQHTRLKHATLISTPPKWMLDIPAKHVFIHTISCSELSYSVLQVSLAIECALFFPNSLEEQTQDNCYEARSTFYSRVINHVKARVPSAS